jgi:hypothetical protein
MESDSLFAKVTALWRGKGGKLMNSEPMLADLRSSGIDRQAVITGTTEALDAKGAAL